MPDEIQVEFNVPATMRDGIVLRANVFRPAAPGTYPVALTRTPYGKDLFTVHTTLDAVRLARAGYIVVIQDTRGRGASGGEWATMRHEAADGYDTVEWAAGLPGTNGNVGMYGLSYLGFTQWAAAMLAPPHLKALVPVFTWADARDGVFWRGGALELGTMAAWQLTAIGLDAIFRRYRDNPQGLLPALGALVREIDRLRTDGYQALPLQDFAPLHAMDLGTRELAEMIADPNDRAASAPFSPAAAYAHIQVPAYNIGGWYDIFSQGTLQNFRALRTAGATDAARQARVLIGPWTHVGYSHVVGELDFGFVASMEFINLQTTMTDLTRRWFDYWLKGIDNGITREPPVKLFVMGANAWRDEQEWPLARTQYTPFYLHSTGQ